MLSSDFPFGHNRSERSHGSAVEHPLLSTVRVQGGGVCNTPPATLQAGGEDTAVVGVFVTWHEFQGLRERFDALKQAAQEEDAEGSTLVLSNVPFVMRPTGRQTNGGAPYRWILESGGFRFCILNRCAPKDDVPNVSVEIGSLVLMEHGSIESAWEDAMRRLSVLDCTVGDTKLSRVDLCVDLIGVDINAITLDFWNRCYVSRCSKMAIQRDGDHLTGFHSSSGGPLQIRVYDKWLEVQHDEAKLKVLIERRWGTIPDSAVRTEFQIRRDRLKEFGVDSLDDYLSRRASIVAYLCKEWFRMVDDPRDAVHTERAKISPFWSKVISAFESWAGKVNRVAVRVRRRRFDAKQLRSQAGGCLISVLAASEFCCSDVISIRSAIIGELDKWIGEVGRGEIGEILGRRLMEFETQRPGERLVA